MSAGRASRLAHSLVLIAALVAIWQALYWWVGDVALASPLATLDYTAKLFASDRSMRTSSTRYGRSRSRMRSPS